MSPTTREVNMPDIPALIDSAARREDPMDLSPAGADISSSVLAERSGNGAIAEVDRTDKSRAPAPKPGVGPAPGEMTEMFDPIAFLDERMRHGGRPVEPIDSGRYIEIQGPRQTVRIPLDEEIIHIGRGIGADLHLDDSSVSRRHAVLVPCPGGQRILDDRSSNGTFVNGQRVEQADLRDGDVITLGRVALQYVDQSYGGGDRDGGVDGPSVDMASSLTR
jgi:hypothetical protein